VRAHTNILIKASPEDFKADHPSYTYGPPFPGYLYQTPASLACIYGLQPAVSGCNPNVTSLNPTGGGRAVAIVDAFDDPNAYADLATYSGQFGLAAINPSSFIVVYAPPGRDKPGVCKNNATQPPVDPTGGWEVEESLDIQMAHAMAPDATFYLVEAQSNYFTDLLCAVTVARGCFINIVSG
jgi:subtilase family serine protease